MNNRIILLLILIVLTFLSSGCEGFIPGEDELTGTKWRLIDWSDNSLDPLQFTITANFDDLCISGNSAVNYYSGLYFANDNPLFSVRELQVTLMGGSEEAMQAESTYLKLLEQANKFTVKQNALTLFDEANKELLLFSKIGID